MTAGRARARGTPRPTRPSRSASSRPSSARADSWRRIGPAALAGADAVARPLALLECLGPGDPPIVSWSTITAPALILGRGVRPDDVNTEWCRARGIPVLGRRSGGGPVLWDADLIGCDVVLPPDHPLAARDVTRAYAWLGEAVSAALGRLGARVRAVPLDEARALQARTDATSLDAARTCFGGVSPFEVLTDDLRKVVGLAQVRRAAGTIFQCGILVGFDPDALAAAVARDADDRRVLAEALAARVAGLRDLVPHVDAARVIAEIDAELVARLGIGWQPSELRPEEKLAATRLAAEVVI